MFSRQDNLKIFVIALSYFLAHFVSFLFPDAENVIMAIWPAGGIALASLLLNPRRLWPAILISLFVAGNTADLLEHRLLLNSIGFMSANIVESLGCALLITGICGEKVRFDRVKDILALILGATLVNACSACIGAGVATMTSGAMFWKFWLTWWISDGLGILIITPLIVVWRNLPTLLTGVRWGQLAERGAFLFVWCMVSWFAFSPADHLISPYTPVVLLTWPALRFGQRGVITAIVLLAVFAIITLETSVSSNIWGGKDLNECLLLAQLYIGAIAISGMMLAASFAERKQAERKSKEAQKFLQNIIDLLPSMVFWKDMNLKYIGCNESFAKGAGKNSAEDVVGKDDFQMCWKDQADRYRANDRQVISLGKEKLNFEEIFPTAQGDIRWVKTSKIPLTDAEGNSMGVLGVLEDITESKRVHQEILDALNYAQTLFSTSPIAIITYKMSGQAVSANDAAARLVGTTIENVKRQNFRELESWKKSGFFDKAQKAFETRQEQSLECHTISTYGADMWVSARFIPFHFEGQPHLMLLAMDISGRKQAEKYALEASTEKARADAAKQKEVEATKAYQELQKTQAQLTQAEKLSAIGTLSAGVAHELNSPLAGILGIARFYLAHKAPDDREYRDIEQIIKAGERMSKIIKGLRDFSRPSTGEKEDLDLNETIEMVLNFGQEILLGPYIDLRKDFAQDLPKIKADKNQIQQVIVNLISNAIDAMQKKGELKISTRTVMVNENRFVEMEFMDSGCGINKEDLPKIFEPFYTTKKPGEGTGLGLSVIYSIIENHHGKILVESPPADQKTGAAFKVRIPAVKRPFI